MENKEYLDSIFAIEYLKKEKKYYKEAFTRISNLLSKREILHNRVLREIYRLSKKGFDEKDILSFFEGKSIIQIQRMLKKGFDKNLLPYLEEKKAKQIV